jgi:integrase
MKQLVKLNKRPNYSGQGFKYVLRYTENGKRKWKTLGHANRRKAEKQRAQKEKELRMGYVEPSSMRLRDFMEDSLRRTGDQIRESTRTDYKQAMEDFIKIVGNIDYLDIQQAHGEFFRQKCLDSGISPATVAKKLRSLKRFFNLAVQRKQLEENPLKFVKVPKVPQQEVKIYTKEEIRRMIKAASQIQKESSLDWDILISLAITTGMRKSELLNLVWSDIDFDEMVIEVTPKENTPETWEWQIKDTDRRRLPLTENVSHQLIQLQNRRPEGYAYVFAPPSRCDHILKVLRPKGKWTLSSARNCVVNTFTKNFNKILATANVRKGTFHDIRKTAITHWFRRGLREYEVMSLAGHAKFSTTHKFYLAIADDLIDRARKATAQEFNPKILQQSSTESKGAMKS